MSQKLLGLVGLKRRDFVCQGWVSQAIWTLHVHSHWHCLRSVDAHETTRSPLLTLTHAHACLCASTQREAWKEEQMDMMQHKVRCRVGVGVDVR